MKLSVITVAVSLMFVIACSNPDNKEKKVILKEQKKPKKQEVDKMLLHDELQHFIIDTVLIGDLNSDQINDTAFIYTPQTIASVDKHGKIHFWNDCVDHNCYNRIRFSALVPVLKHNMSVWGTLQNAGDLDNDGFAELLFNPGWFHSSWTHLCLYSLKNNKWKKIADVITRRENLIGSMKKNLILRNNNYYLKGIRFIDAEDTPYMVKIPLAVLKDSTSNQKSDTIQKL